MHLGDRGISPPRHARSRSGRSREGNGSPRRTRRRRCRRSSCSCSGWTPASQRPRNPPEQTNPRRRGRKTSPKTSRAGATPPMARRSNRARGAGACPGISPAIAGRLPPREGSGGWRLFGSCPRSSRFLPFPVTGILGRAGGVVIRGICGVAGAKAWGVWNRLI